MRAHNYCKVCGERNAANVARCSVCHQEMHNNPRTNPVNSASFRSPTLIIFDIDDTILNVSQRYKDARRGNYLNKDGSPKKKSTFETLGKARKRAEEFLFSPDNLRKDTAIPGAIGLVNELASQGHTIAYVTARSAKFRDVTRNQLEDKGFPIFKDESDMELLFLKAKLGESMAQYKEGVYAKLLASYDVRMVFDDMKENLQAAVSQGITGVYPSIQDYTRYQVKSNPSHLVDYHKGQQFVMHEHPDVAGRMMIDPDDEDGRTVAETSSVDVYTGEAKNPPLNCGCGKSPCMTFGGLKNPGDIQSRVESILIKEGGAAGLKPLKAAFPKGTTKKQATAAIAKMDSVRLHQHGDYILKNPLNIRHTNPDYYLCQYCGHEADPVEYEEIRSDPSLNIGGTSPICPYCGNQNAYEPRYDWQDEGYTMAPLSFKNPTMEETLREMEEEKEERKMGGTSRDYGSQGQYYRWNPEEGIRSTFEDEDEYVPEYDTLDEAIAGPYPTAAKMGFPYTVYEHEDLLTGRTYFTRSDENMAPTNVKEKHYIARNPEEYSEDYMVPRDIHRLGKAADSLDDTYDEQDVPEWWKSKLSVTAKDADTLADSLDYVANNPADVLPMMSGEPSGKHTKLGAVFSEIFIGRNVIKDVGEGIQGIYRGLIGGRTSMAEKRMAMAVASMQKELSDRAKALGGNALANIKVDYELPQGTASVTIIASADAIKMARPPKKNPNYSIDEDFERMKKMAYDVRTREVAGEPINGREWWNQQSPWIEERYGTEPLDVTWAMPLNTEGFDPQDKSQEFDDNGVKPLHFLNQLKRIPMTKQPTPERIMQIALNIGQGQASGSVETDFTLDDFIIRQNPLPLMGLSVQVSGHRNAAGAFVMKGKKFLILQRSKKETSKHGLWELPGGKVEAGETPRQTAVIETKEEAGLDIKLKANLGPHHDNKKKKTYHAYTGVAKKGQRVKLSEEHSAHKWVTPEEVMAMPKKMVSHHLMYFLKKEGETIRNNPRSNPPKNKVEKGKKLYEHMNGRAPEKIEKKKIDMGDVWYQVGEGGCWQIGYMSGKETGKSEQKYTHTFNEETKDGNFPKLYATMPENGKPMLIITGGTWKIRTDDKGVAWIYD